MKKAFFLLAAMCCMMVNAGNLTVTYKPLSSSLVTLTDGTHDLGAYHGSITISGNDITFNNVCLRYLSEGFTITPTSLTESYSPHVTFKGYNHIEGYENATTPTLQFMGNPNEVHLDGDALYIEGMNSNTATLFTQAGSFRVTMLELHVENYSDNNYAVVMGTNKKMTIQNKDSYSRVYIRNRKTARQVMERYPILSGNMQAIYEGETGYAWEYATADYREDCQRSVGKFNLNDGNMPYIERFLPGLKSGNATIENGSAGYTVLTLKNAEIETGRLLYSGHDTNLEIKVQGTNNISTNYSLVSIDQLNNDMRGHIIISGVGNDAKLTVKDLGGLSTIYNTGFINFKNLTAKLITTGNITFIENENKSSDPDYHQFIIDNTAKLMLLQANVNSTTPAIIKGFTNLGSGNVYAAPTFGAFVNNNFYAEDGETPLHEVYFDSEDYHIVLNESTPVCSLNAEDVMHNGRVRYEDNTLFVNDFDLDDIIADNTLNLTGNNSEIRAIYATDLHITGSSDFSVLDEILTEKITFENTNFNLYGEINNLDEVPTLIDCHALEYDDFKLEGGVLYGVKGETSEVVERLTIVKNGEDGVINVNANANANKRLINGQLLILREGKTYNAQGAELR